QRDAAAGANQAGRRCALGRRAQIDRATLDVLAPSSPVVTIADQGTDFVFGGQGTFRHVWVLRVRDCTPGPGDAASMTQRAIAVDHPVPLWHICGACDPGGNRLAKGWGSAKASRWATLGR